MSAEVRMFAYAGVAQAYVADYQQQFSANAIGMYKEPYLAKQMLTVDTGVAQSSSVPLGAQGSKVLRVQVQPGKRVHYEITLPNHDARVATAESPIIEDNDQLWWTSGAIISLLEAAAVS